MDQFCILDTLGRFEPRSEGSFRHWLVQCVECKIVDLDRNLKAKKRGRGKIRRFGDMNSEILRPSMFPGQEPTPSAVMVGKEMEERVRELERRAAQLAAEQRANGTPQLPPVPESPATPTSYEPG